MCTWAPTYGAYANVCCARTSLQYSQAKDRAAVVDSHACDSISYFDPLPVRLASSIKTYNPSKSQWRIYSVDAWAKRHDTMGNLVLWGLRHGFSGVSKYMSVLRTSKGTSRCWGFLWPREAGTNTGQAFRVLLALQPNPDWSLNSTSHICHLLIRVRPVMTDELLFNAVIQRPSANATLTSRRLIYSNTVGSSRKRCSYMWLFLPPRSQTLLVYK